MLQDICTYPVDTFSIHLNMGRYGFPEIDRNNKLCFHLTNRFEYFYSLYYSQTVVFECAQGNSSDSP